MAITFLSAGHNGRTADASGCISAHEDIWHVVDSTNKNIPGFKYLFDIYKGAELLTRIANITYGQSGYGILNVGNIIRSGIQIDFLEIELTLSVNSGLTIYAKNTDYWFTNYEVRYGEICGTTNLGEPIILDNLVSGTYTAYNTYNRHTLHGSGAKLSDSKVFLTNRPNTTDVYNGEPVVLSLSERSISNNYNIHVSGVTYTPNTNPPETYTILTNNSVNPSNSLIYFGVNQLTGYDEYAVSVVAGISPKPELRFKSKCSKYKPYTLVFLNCYGGWDSFTFINGNIITENEKKKYEQNRWRLDEIQYRMEDNYSFQTEAMFKPMNIQYEGMKTYGVKFKTKMKLTSDILNTDEYKWLFELIVSPIVYIWDKNADTLYPVQITDSNYEMKNSLQNKTEFLEVNIDVFDQNTQYR